VAEVSDLKIRDAMPKDVQAMVDIAVEAFWKEYGSLEEAEKMFKSVVARRWKRIIERKTGIVPVAEKNGENVVFPSPAGGSAGMTG